MDVDSSRDRDRSRRNERSRFSDDNIDRDRSVDRGRKHSNAVYVSNIPYECAWQELKDEFRKKIGEVKFVELFVDENNKSKGCGIVEFDDNSSVKKALEQLHRIEFKGRKLIVKEDFGLERDKHGNFLDRRDNSRDRGARNRGGGGGGRNDSFSMSSRGMNDDKMGTTWGLSPQFLDSLRINGPLVNKVFVANLDYKVDEKKLREVFKLAGKVVEVELYRDKDGKSRGCGVIEFDHPVESVQAISMFHDQQLYDRPMTVRMDAMDDERSVRYPEGLKNVGMGLGMNGQPLKNVTTYLQANNSVSGSGGGLGAGILGAVPSGLGNLGSALSSIVNTPALAALTSLQGVPGVQNQLLSGINDLGLNMNQSNYGYQSSSNNSSNPMGMFSSDQNMSRDFSSTGNSRFDNNSMNRTNNFLNKNDFSVLSQNPGLFNSGSQSQRLSGNNPMDSQDKSYSESVIISNISPTVSFKTLKEKFASCGNIQYFDGKSKDTVVITYGNRWEAEKAIQMFDQYRIDGRTISVRFF